ncbi:MAG: hypothetical protein KGL39_21010 [Patescibacteria group bacterium]|nr:hypothetical protein [Patescibacteria group bacterium]
MEHIKVFGRSVCQWFRDAFVPILCGTVYRGFSLRGRLRNFYLGTASMLVVALAFIAPVTSDMPSSLSSTSGSASFMAFGIARLVVWVGVAGFLIFGVGTRNDAVTRRVVFAGFLLAVLPAVILALVPVGSMIGVEPPRKNPEFFSDFGVTSLVNYYVYATRILVGIGATSMGVSAGVNAMPSAMWQVGFNARDKTGISELLGVLAVGLRFQTAFVFAQVWYFLVDDWGPFFAFVWFAGYFTTFIEVQMVRVGCTAVYYIVLFIAFIRFILFIGELPEALSSLIVSFLISAGVRIIGIEGLSVRYFVKAVTRAALLEIIVGRDCDYNNAPDVELTVQRLQALPEVVEL